jgi:hypothetical protein
MTAAAVSGKTTVGATVAAVSGESTVTGKTATSNGTTVKAAAGITASGESPIDRATVYITVVDITAIYEAAIDVPTGIAGITKSGAEAGPVKPSAVKISGIGPFKEGPVMGVVIVVPIVTIPGGIVIIRIAREFIIEICADYHTGGRGIFILVNGCRNWFRVDLSLAAGSDQTGGYYCGECKERFHDS